MRLFWAAEQLADFKGILSSLELQEMRGDLYGVTEAVWTNIQEAIIRFPSANPQAIMKRTLYFCQYVR